RRRPAQPRAPRPLDRRAGAPSRTLAPAGTGVTLTASMALRRGSFELDAELDAGDGEVVAVLGPNGSGKTTLLAALAGLVALARALATRPRMLLLDEPLAAVDAGGRPGLRREIARQLGEAGGVRLLVTHDPVDAMALASRLVILEGGRVVQHGTPLEVRRRP